MEDAKGSRTKHLLECLGLVATLAATVTGIYVSLRSQPTEERAVADRDPVSEPDPSRGENHVAEIEFEPAATPSPSADRSTMKTVSVDPENVRQTDAVQIDPADIDRFMNRHRSIETAQRQLEELVTDYPQSLFEATVPASTLDATSGGWVSASRLRIEPAGYRVFAEKMKAILRSARPESPHGDLVPELEFNVRITTDKGVPHMDWVDSDRQAASAWRQAWASGSVADGKIPQTLIILDPLTGSGGTASALQDATLRGTMLVVAPELQEPLLELLHRFESLHLSVEAQGPTGNLIHRHHASVTAPLANTRSELKWVSPLFPVGQRWSLDHSRLAPMPAFRESERSRTDVNDVLCLAPMMATLAKRDLRMSTKDASRLRDTEAAWTTQVDYQVPLSSSSSTPPRVASVSASLIF